MERKIINPSKWQDSLGFVQGHEVTGGQRVLYCAGQISVDADGKTLHAGDFRGQLNRTIDNLEQVLTSAGFGFSDVVRLNIYTTDMEGFSANRNVIRSVWWAPEPAIQARCSGWPGWRGPTC